MGEAERQVDRYALLIDAGLALASELDLEAVLERIVELAIEITDARYGALGVLGESTPRIERFITKGISDEDRAAIGHIPVGEGILGLLIRERRPMRIPDIGADPRADGFPPNHPPMHSFLGAPVIARGMVFGNIYLTEKQGASEFNEEDEAALVVLAIQAGVAIENARLYDEKELAQRELARLELLEERERIAKELHDGVIQSLFAVGMGLQGTAAMSPDEEIGRRLEGAVEEIDRAIRDLRNYIFGLRPGILADRQLDQALQELGSRVQRPIRRASPWSTSTARSPLNSPGWRAMSIQVVARGAVERRPARGRDQRAGSRSGASTRAPVLEIDDDGERLRRRQPRGDGAGQPPRPGASDRRRTRRGEPPGRGHHGASSTAVVSRLPGSRGADAAPRAAGSSVPCRRTAASRHWIGVRALLHRAADVPGAGDGRPGPSP